MRKAQKRKSFFIFWLTCITCIFTKRNYRITLFATNASRFLLPLASRPVDTGHGPTQEPASAELHLPDNAGIDQESDDALDGQAVQRESYTFPVSLRDMRQGLPASRHLAEAHATRVRQGAQVQVSVLRPQDQATWQFVPAYPHQSSRKECLL